MADRIGVLRHGRLLAEGSLAELRARAGRGATLEDVFVALTEGAEAVAP
jgi:ABC-2 type transport system ATP-binding protein